MLLQHHHWLPVFMIAWCIFLVPGCENNPPANPHVKIDANKTSVLRFAVTTSTQDSGLLDMLVPLFEQSHACRVDVIAVGSGAALKKGESGDVDVVLVHAPAAEDAFMKAGHGIRHEPLMHNYFLIAGPVEDLAGIRGKDLVVALKTIAEGSHRFISRGDGSGTHQRECDLWQKAGGRPPWDDYIESGQGQGKTMMMADEMNAYVLCDQATWLKQSDKYRLVPLLTGTDKLHNPYAVMVVDPSKHPSLNVKLAHSFVDFLISVETQILIADYQINGHTLFHPDRLSEESTK